MFLFFLIFIPIPIKAKYFVPILIVGDLFFWYFKFIFYWTNCSFCSRRWSTNRFSYDVVLEKKSIQEKQMGFMSRFLNKFWRLNIAEKIIFVNIFSFCFKFSFVCLFYLFKIPETNFYYYFELLPNVADLLFRPWSLITYGFIHASFGHLFWNMILFYYFSTLFFEFI